jgi:hypothetical protein
VGVRVNLPPGLRSIPHASREVNGVPPGDTSVLPIGPTEQLPWVEGKLRLFFEEVEKGLAVAVHRLGTRCPAALFFDEDFRLEDRTDVVGALVGHTNLDRLRALVSSGGIEIQAIAAGVEIGATVSAFVCNLDLVLDLNFSRTVVAARDQMKSCLHAASRPLRTRGRFGFAFALAFVILILIAGGTILSAHFLPQILL